MPRTIACGLAGATLAVTVGMRSLSEPSILVEYAVYGLLCTLLLAHASVRERLATLPKEYRVGLGCGLVMLLLGQAMPDNRLLFPFIRWSMFVGIAATDSVYYDYVGSRADGTEVRLLPGDGAPLGAAPLLFKLHPLVAQLDARGEQDRDPVDMGRVLRVLHLLANDFNRSHSDVPVVAVAVLRRTVPLHGYRGPASIQSETIFRVRVTGAEGDAPR